jgi:RND family efflux transporter MFP subunit
MNRTRAIVAGAVLLGIIIVVLLNNRASISAKSRNEFQGAIPVTVAEARSQKLSETLSLVGTITAINDVAITAEVAGKVTGVLASVGDQVKAGAPIIQIDDELKKAAFEQAEANYDRAKRDFDRFKSLRAEQSATESQKENAWTGFKVAEAQYIVAKRQLHDTKVCTPIAGIVSARNVELGTMVNDRMVVANVVDVSRLKVKLNVAERDAFKLKTGDRVEVTTDVYPGVKFEGRTTSISAKADEGHTYPVEITMENSAEHPLKAGMFGRISFLSLAPTEVLAIPREALVGSMKDPRVYVVDASLARVRTIVVGGEAGTDLMVLSGLRAGESVVVNGQNNLKDSVAVQVLK